MLENVVDPILSSQVVKTQADQFKTQTVNILTYRKYYELLTLDETTYNIKSTQDANFSSKPRQNIYEIEQLPNDDDED